MFRRLAIVSAAGLLAAATVATAPRLTTEGQPPSDERQPESPRGRGDGRRGDGGGAPANLEGAMKQMNRSLRQLRGQITDASKKEDSLRLIGEMERACVTAKAMRPEQRRGRGGRDGEGTDGEKAAAEAAQAKRVATFRQDLIGALRKLLDVEQDVLADKFDAANADLDELVKLRAAAHKELGVKDD